MRNEIVDVNEFPEMKVLFDKLMVEKKRIEMLSAPLRKKYNMLQSQISPIQDELRELGERIKKIEQPKLGEISNRLSVIARALGGKSISQGV